MIDTYQDFVTKFLSVINSVALSRTLRLKCNTKPWFDIDVLNTIQNCDKYYKTSNDQAKLLPKKIINNKKKLYFEEKIRTRK